MSLRNLLLLVLIAFVFFVSCSDSPPLCEDVCATGISQCTEGKQRQCESVDGCARWSEWTQCAGGACADGSTCGACTHTCDSVGVTECVSGQTRTCQANAGGCLAWSDWSDCADDFCANASTCGTCSHTCGSVGAAACVGGQIRTCQVDANNCRAWGDWFDCASGFCSNETCGNCNNTCPAAGASECVDGQNRTCQVNADGCLAWTDWSNCAGGFCANELSCGTCSHACGSVGATECVDGQTRTCQADANNCRAWGELNTCSEGMCHNAMSCNGAPVAVLACPTSAVATESVSFDASGSSDPEGDALTYSFDFGDGTPATRGSEAIVEHTFAADRDYSVVLTVTDSGGASRTDSCRLTVSRPVHPDMLISSDTQLCGEVYAGRFEVRDGATVTCPTGALTVYAEEVFVDASSSIDLSGTSSVASGANYAFCSAGSNSYCYMAYVGGSGGGGATPGASSRSTTGTRLSGSSCVDFTCTGRPGGEAVGNRDDISAPPGGAGGAGCGGFLESSGGCFNVGSRAQGGGTVKLVATQSMSISGAIRVNGANGYSSTYSSTAGGGGGAGGSILLISDELTLDGTLSAFGGTGGAGSAPSRSFSSAYGGNGGQGWIKLAYGTRYSQTGSFSAEAVVVESVMPPLELSSSTHPNPDIAYNDSFEAFEVSWPVPFAGAQGYWYALNQTPDFALTPTNGTFTSATSVRIPRSAFTSEGTWYFHVVTINASSITGTMANRFRIQLNGTAHTVSSTSHPSQTSWYPGTAFLVSWDRPSDTPEDSFVGYWYRLDRVSNSGTSTGTTGWTYTAEPQVLLTYDASGQPLSSFAYYFHLAAEDTRGNLTNDIAHYLVQIGTEPARTNLFGYVEQGDGTGIDGATVRLEPYGLTQTTDANGYFLFSELFEGPYTLTVTQAGYPTLTQPQEVSASASPVSLVL